MKTLEENTSWLPVEGEKVENKIYVYPETDHEVNLGPFYGAMNERRWVNDYREEIDRYLQRTIKFINNLVAYLPNDVHWLLDNEDYADSLWILHKLKDALCLLEKSDSLKQKVMMTE